MGLRRLYRADAPCRLRLDGSRLLSAPWGLDGGHEGGKGQFLFSPGVAPFVRGNGELQPGDIVTIVTPGAGGYGPASQRDPQAAAREIAEGRLAAADYEEAGT